MGEEPIWLLREWVDEAHNRALSTHGGLQGVRDANALEAALASPRNLWAYGAESDLFFWLLTSWLRLQNVTATATA